jgi:hypothetical protein
MLFGIDLRSSISEFPSVYSAFGSAFRSAFGSAFSSAFCSATPLLRYNAFVSTLFRPCRKIVFALFRVIHLRRVNDAAWRKLDATRCVPTSYALP